ncbi:hypothetical protein ILUMI_00673 [Ignelater luminosus]|uniref:Uncharacterized protein n=1 Tax=Ignelater luminosus TaxID=2038154 RepID=A0A8K0DL62_IGNLU|nr:hypothetical protein ILUMI_00673 [Ignelater luminosus]
MSEREMLEIYQVLRHSRNTACEEDEQRRILQQAEANYKELEELRKNSVPVENDGKDDDAYILGSFGDIATCSSNEERDDTKEKSFSSDTFDVEQELPSTTIATKYSQVNKNEKSKPEEVDFIDVFDCVPTKHGALKHIPVSPQYNPPFYCSRKVTDKEIKERARMIYSYHLALHRIYDNYQRQSIYPAPWGKAIQPTLRFNGSLLKKIEKLEETTPALRSDAENVYEFMQDLKNDKNSDDDFETYTSKSGRQTKRKLYAEDLDDDDELHKKSKSATDVMEADSEWLAKRKPATTAGNNDKKPTSVRKRRSIGTLSNEEIMKRSRLFTDNGTNSTRTEKMFDKLTDDDRKKKEVERELEKFSDSLAPLSDEENVENIEQSQEIDIADIVHIEEPFTRRRIVPPSHARKPGRGRGAAGRGRGRKTNKSTQEGTSQEITSPKYQPLETSSVKKGNSRKKDRCPICNEEFLQSELVEHASSCIEGYSEKNDRKKTSDYHYKRITCETCDEVLPFDTNYEVHVHECIMKQMKQNSTSS